MSPTLSHPKTFEVFIQIFYTDVGVQSTKISCGGESIETTGLEGASCYSTRSRLRKIVSSYPDRTVLPLSYTARPDFRRSTCRFLIRKRIYI